MSACEDCREHFTDEKWYLISNTLGHLSVEQLFALEEYIPLLAKGKAEAEKIYFNQENKEKD